MSYNHKVSMRFNQLVVDEALAIIRRNQAKEDKSKKAYEEYLLLKEQWKKRDIERSKYYDRLIYERDFIPLDSSDYVFYVDPERPGLRFEQDDNLCIGFNW